MQVVLDIYHFYRWLLIFVYWYASV